MVSAVGPPKNVHREPNATVITRCETMLYLLDIVATALAGRARWMKTATTKTCSRCFRPLRWTSNLKRKLKCKTFSNGYATTERWCRARGKWTRSENVRAAVTFSGGGGRGGTGGGNTGTRRGGTVGRIRVGVHAEQWEHTGTAESSFVI